MATSDLIIQQIVAAVVDGESEPVVAAVTCALESGVDAETILNDGLTAAMALVGQMLDRGEVFIPDVLWSAEAMQDGLALLLPHLADGVAQRPARSSSAPCRETCTTSARTSWA